jgi:hypothetical protein
LSELPSMSGAIRLTVTVVERYPSSPTDATEANG